MGRAPVATKTCDVQNLPLQDLDAAAQSLKEDAEVPADVTEFSNALRVAVLSNPLSRRNRGKGMGEVRKLLGESSGVLHYEVKTPAEIAAALEELAHAEVGVVVVNGGDGTVQAALSALFKRQLFETLPFLAVLPSGTTNVIAKNVGLRGKRMRALRTLLDRASSGKQGVPCIRHPVLRVQISPNRDPLFGMCFSAAASVKATRYYHKNLHALRLPGELGPGLALARFLIGLVRGDANVLRPVPMTIALNGRQAEKHDCLALLITTLEQLLLGLRPYWGSESGALHYTAIAARPKYALRVLPFLLRGRKTEYATPQHGYFSHNVDEVRLHLESEFVLDGEIFEPISQFEPVVVNHAGSAPFVRF